MKKYEYDGKIYCDEDLSCEIDNYGGDLYDLFFKLKEHDKAEEYISYHCPLSASYYESIEDFIQNECEDLEVE